MARFGGEERSRSKEVEIDDEEDILNSLGDLEYNIVNAIEKSDLPEESIDYLIDVILDIESLKEAGSEEIISIAKDIAYEYKFKFLGEGTSRLAILDNDDNVLKISHRMLGDVDNRFEKAITQLVLDKHVSRDCANRLALCFDVELDTDWVIAQEEYAPLAKNQTNNKGRAAIKYVIQNYDDYKDMIGTLEAELFLSDIHPKRGFNIGLDEKSRMVVIDHGLFIPLCLIDNGVVFDSGFSYKKGKFHCKCGSAIHYDIPKLSGNLEDDIDDLIDDGSPLSAERYICPDCRTLYDTRRMYKEILDSIDLDVRGSSTSRKRTRKSLRR